jgi:RNA polymerase sigma factor (sigma-70 family)
MTADPLTPVLRQARKLAGLLPHGRASDAALLERFTAARDPAAFEALVRRHGGLVWRVCRRVLRGVQDAEDAWQATFCCLARRAGSVRKPAALASWLHGVAFRLADKARRSAERRQARERRASPPAAPDPAREAAWRELGVLIEEELHRLAEKHRLPLLLTYWQGLANEQAARQLGCPSGTFKARLARARDLLRDRLVRRGVTLPAGAVALLLAPAGSAEAAVPPGLPAAITRAGVLFTAGSPGGGCGLVGASGRLVARALPAAVAGKVTVAVLAVILGAVVLGGGLLARQPAEAEGGPKPAAKGTERPGPGASDRARADRHGDPLPPEALARVGTVRLRHGALIRSLAFTADGKTLLSSGENGVRLWNAATGAELRHLPASGLVLTASHSADGRWVATFGPDRAGHEGGPAQVWDATTGQKAAALGKGSYHSVLLDPAGKLLATLGYGTTLDPHPPAEVWDRATGRRLRSWKLSDSVRLARFAPDSKTLVIGTEDRKVQFWDVATGRKVREIRGIPSAGYIFALSAGGTLLAVVAHSEPPPKGGRGPENHVLVWDTASGKEIRRLIVPARALWSGFRALAFSADEKLLAAPGVDELLLWEPRTGKLVRRIPYRDANPLALAFSPDGKTLAAADGSAVRLFDVASGQELCREDGPQGMVRVLALSPDGRTLAARADTHGVTLWDSRTGRQRQRLDGHALYAMPVADDGRTLFSPGADGTLRVFDLATGKLVRCLGAETFGGQGWRGLLAVSTDGSRLALRAGKQEVAVVDARTGKELRRFDGGEPLRRWAAFTPDGRLLVVWNAAAERAHVWDVAAGKELRRLSAWDGPRPAADGHIPDLGVPFALSPDGSLLAFPGPGKSILLRALASGEVVRRVEAQPSARAQDRVRVLVFSPDGRTLAWSGHWDPDVRLIEVATGRERHRLRGHRGPVTSLTFSADGKALASGSEDTTALLWDLTGTLGAAGPASGQPDLDACWGDLAGKDAARAYQAMRRLLGRPSAAVADLGKRLRPVLAVDSKRLAQLIAELDSPRFPVRARAEKELEGLGEVAVPACREALRRGASAEASRRLERLLAKQARDAREPSPDRLRGLRAVEVLEWIGTPQAREVLRRLAGGAAEAGLTREARATLGRLAAP